MKHLKWLIRAYLYVQVAWQKITGTGAFGKDQAIYVQGFPADTGNPVKDGLIRHHVKQFHESSCSVASVAAVVNTLLDRDNALNGKPVTQQDLLEKVRTAHWKERMGENGYKGRRGLPLETLTRVVESSLNVYQVRYRSVEMVPAAGDPKKNKALLLSRLKRFEADGNCLMIAHFDQGCFIRDLHIPHISPVGGFDPVTGTVTLLDVDPSQAFFYQVSFDAFYKGLSSNYNHMFRLFGYKEGGYVYIRL